MAKKPQNTKAAAKKSEKTKERGQDKERKEKEGEPTEGSEDDNSPDPEKLPPAEGAPTEFSDLLIIRWAKLEISRIYSNNIADEYRVAQWHTIETISAKWIPVLGGLVQTYVNGSAQGNPKPFVLPLINTQGGLGSNQFKPEAVVSLKHFPAIHERRDMFGTLVSRAPKTVEQPGSETTVEVEEQFHLRRSNIKDKVSYKLLSTFLFLRSVDPDDVSKQAGLDASSAAAFDILMKIGNAVAGKMVAAGKFSSPVNFALGFAQEKFSAFLGDAFKSNAGASDLLFEMEGTPVDLPIVKTIPPSTKTEPKDPSPFIRLKDDRKLIAIDTYDWIAYKPRPDQVFPAWPDVKVRWEAQARCMALVDRSYD